MTKRDRGSIFILSDFALDFRARRHPFDGDDAPFCMKGLRAVNCRCIFVSRRNFCARRTDGALLWVNVLRRTGLEKGAGTLLSTFSVESRGVVGESEALDSRQTTRGRAGCEASTIGQRRLACPNVIEARASVRDTATFFAGQRRRTFPNSTAAVYLPVALAPPRQATARFVSAERRTVVRGGRRGCAGTLSFQLLCSV